MPRLFPFKLRETRHELALEARAYRREVTNIEPGEAGNSRRDLRFLRCAELTPPKSVTSRQYDAHACRDLFSTIARVAPATLLPSLAITKFCHATASSVCVTTTRTQ